MSCGMKSRRNGNPHYREGPRLNVLLTNGRFPVSLDLARQFYWAGHKVFSIDPMGYPVCKFSRSVSQSAQVPAPHNDARGFVKAVKKLIEVWKIDMIVPIHEEILFLADSREPEIISRLFAPPFELLLRLHHKYEFTKLMQDAGLEVPETYLCRSIDDVVDLPLELYPHGMVLKPVFGRACSEVYHIRPGQPLPEDINVGEHNHYIAQEWLVGDRYCSYTVVRNGQAEATGCYPVLETSDGSSSVFFQQKHYPPVYEYIQRFVTAMPAFSGQIAFDFIETADGIFAIECKPRATSGLHLWSDTPFLTRAITGTLPKEEIERPIRPPRKMLGRESHFQVAAGMLMWEHKNASFKVWAAHMRRLVFTRDVIWKWRDPMPTIAQPFLLTEYYRMCRREGLQLPKMFQLQLVWEPKGEELDRIRAMLSTKEDDHVGGPDQLVKKDGEDKEAQELE